MKPNRYAGICDVCDSPVPARAGVLGEKQGGRWRVRHTPCSLTVAGRGFDAARLMRPVSSIRLNSGYTATVNSRGRCEDAPCCGCCTGDMQVSHY